LDERDDELAELVDEALDEPDEELLDEEFEDDLEFDDELDDDDDELVEDDDDDRLVFIFLVGSRLCLWLAASRSLLAGLIFFIEFSKFFKFKLDEWFESYELCRLLSFVALLTLRLFLVYKFSSCSFTFML
jgi:hypothetical protein